MHAPLLLIKNHTGIVPYDDLSMLGFESVSLLEGEEGGKRRKGGRERGRERKGNKEGGREREKTVIGIIHLCMCMYFLETSISTLLNSGAHS